MSTTIRIDLVQLGFPYNTTYAGPRPTYINLHSDPPKHEPVCCWYILTHIEIHKRMDIVVAFTQKYSKYHIHRENYVPI